MLSRSKLRNRLRINRNTRTVLNVETLEAKRCLAVVGFASTVIEKGNSFFGDVIGADIDADGDDDIVVSKIFSEDQIAWHENLDNGQEFGESQLIHRQPGFSFSVAAADMDSDGDLDVVAAGSFSDEVAWYSNQDTAFTRASRPVASSANGVATIDLGDIDGDGDIDVVAASYDKNELEWYANDGQGNFAFDAPNQIRRVLGPREVVLEDFDGDGDLDLAYSAAYCDEGCESIMGWYENRDGLGDFGNHSILYVGDKTQTIKLASADLDSDGDHDLIAGFRGADDPGLAVYENAGGQFDDPVTLSNDAEDIVVGDVDADGDDDIVALQSVQGGNELVWYENDAQANFAESVKVRDLPADSTARLFSANLDQDNYLEIGIAITCSLFVPSDACSNDLLVTEARTVIGDVTGDDIFGTADLVAVFQAGEYEDGIDGNSTYAEGDWDGDGDFGTSDLVLAFEQGDYNPVAARPSIDLATARNGFPAHIANDIALMRMIREDERVK